jgi:hypothetical protein
MHSTVNAKAILQRRARRSNTSGKNKRKRLRPPLGPKALRVPPQEAVLLLASTTADRRIVEAHKTATTCFAAFGNTIAAGLQEIATIGVAAGAGNAAAVFSAFACALAAGQIALHTANTVLAAAERTEALRQHAAKILQRSASHVIIAAAVQFETSFTLFKRDGAARHHLPISHRWGRRCGRPTGCQ